MAVDIVLYEYGMSRSRQVRWTLLELGLEFQAKEGLDYLHSEELIKVSPLGKVPAVLINGEPLFESAAICTYLADLVPEKGLIAASGTRERALHLQWVSFALSELEAYLWSNARNKFILPEAQRITALFKQNATTYVQNAQVLERHLTDHPYMVADQFSVTDILVGFIVNWGSGAGLLKELPQLNAYLDRLKTRPHHTL